MAQQPLSYSGAVLGGPSMDIGGGWYPDSVALRPADVRIWNRGRTLAGIVVYWTSPLVVDAAGDYYPFSDPPWSAIVEVVGVDHSVA